jgi:hypothetical protein
LTQKLPKKIAQYQAQIEQKNQVRFQKNILHVLAFSLFAIGVGFLFFYDWLELGRKYKMVLACVPFTLGLGMVIFAVLKEKHSALWREVAAGMASLGGFFSVSLYENIIAYNVYYENLYEYSQKFVRQKFADIYIAMAFYALGLAYYFRSFWAFLVFGVLATSHFQSSHLYENIGVWFALGILISVFTLHTRLKNQNHAYAYVLEVFTHCVLSLCLVILFCINTSSAVHLLCGGFLLVILHIFFHKNRYPAYYKFFAIFGAMIWLLITLHTSIFDKANVISIQNIWDKNQLFSWFIIAIGTLSAPYYAWKEKWHILYLPLLLLILKLHHAFFQGNLEVYQIIWSLAILNFSWFYIYLGLKNKTNLHINLGLILLVIAIWERLSTWQTNALVNGIVFIVLGALFLFINKKQA